MKIPCIVFVLIRLYSSDLSPERNTVSLHAVQNVIQPLFERMLVIEKQHHEIIELIEAEAEEEKNNPRPPKNARMASSRWATSAIAKHINRPDGDGLMDMAKVI